MYILLKNNYILAGPRAAAAPTYCRESQSEGGEDKAKRVIGQQAPNRNGLGIRGPGLSSGFKWFKEIMHMKC